MIRDVHASDLQPGLLKELSQLPNEERLAYKKAEHVVTSHLRGEFDYFKRNQVGAEAHPKVKQYAEHNKLADITASDNFLAKRKSKGGCHNCGSSEPQAKDYGKPGIFDGICNNCGRTRHSSCIVLNPDRRRSLAVSAVRGTRPKLSIARRLPAATVVKKVILDTSARSRMRVHMATVATRVTLRKIVLCLREKDALSTQMTP